LRRLLASVLCLLTAFASDCHRNETQNPAGPTPRDANILLITLDTTRADHLSCYGEVSDRRSETAATTVGERRYNGAKTPHLDALASRGVRFTHATAQVPLTLPSHACIMTGAYPPVHGLRDMGGFILTKNHPTIASIVQSAGFQTAAFVGSRVLSKHFGISNGFATYVDDMSGKTAEGMPGAYPELRASVVTDRALEWLKQNGQKKFFLWAHYYDPHAPYDPPEPYRHTYSKDPYSGEIAYTDEQVGRLFDWIDQAGLSSRTLIVVIGDHGESLGEHGEMTHGVFLYDSTLHVPLIMAGSDVPAHQVVHDQVRSIDIMPTALEFLHLSPGAEAQGVSLWPLIRGGRQVRSNYAYLETLYPRTFMGWSELRAMRTDSWKMIVAPHPELYNLEKDPHETDNLITRHPADAGELQKMVWKIAGEGAKQEELTSSPVDSKTRQELESLGYVSAGTPRKIQLGTSAPDPKDRVAVLKILTQVENLLNAKKYPAAAQLMAQGLKLDPPNPLSHIYLALAYERMGQFERAVQVYQEAIQMKLGTDQIYSRMGKDELRLNHLDKALSAMARGSEINPTDLDNLRNLGTAYLQLNRVEDAEKTFKAITVQNDKYSAAYNGLGLVAIRRGDVEGALRNFEKAIETGPDEAEPLLNLGLLYQKTGNKEQAIHYFELFLKKAPREDYAPLLPKVREAIQGLRSGA
jgi:arylsulfatase A-like enzyme/Flp pilus assembly protein TadD